MVDVEDMIGELEGEDDAEDAETADANEKQEEGEEETFGLDLDSAWSSPERGEE
jgi:hypothetical protein